MLQYYFDLLNLVPFVMVFFSNNNNVAEKYIKICKVFAMTGYFFVGKWFFALLFIRDNATIMWTAVL